MSKRKTMGYELLLLMVLALTAVVWATGESQARYANTATWNTFIQPAAGEAVSSDWLQPVGREQTTILLGEMTQAQEQIVFTLQSTEDLTGELKWSTDQPDYLTVTCETDAALTLIKDQLVTVTMTVTVAEPALNTAREAVAAHVTVTWNDALTGRFRLVLPAVADTQVGEPANGETPEQTPETVEEGAAEQPQPQNAVVAVDTLPHFAPDSALPVKVVAAAGVTKVQLGLTDDQAQTLQPFPARTGYEVNGESYVLYRDSVIDIAGPQESVVVYLDFSETEIAAGQTLHLMAEGSGEGLLMGTATVQTTADVELILPAQQPVLTEKEAVELALPVQWKDYPVTYTVEQMVLQKDEQQTEQKLYVPVEDLEGGALRVRTENSEAGYMLVLQTGDTLPAAGTYRIDWKWNYEGVDFGETRSYFFINYLAQSIQSEQTGGAEQ